MRNHLLHLCQSDAIPIDLAQLSGGISGICRNRNDFVCAADEKTVGSGVRLDEFWQGEPNIAIKPQFFVRKHTYTIFMAIRLPNCPERYQILLFFYLKNASLIIIIF